MYVWVFSLLLFHEQAERIAMKFDTEVDYNIIGLFIPIQDSRGLNSEAAGRS